MVNRFFTSSVRFICWSFAILAINCSIGCQVGPQQHVETVHAYWTEQPANHFVSPYFNQLQARRVVIVVRDDRENSYQLQTQFGEHLGRNLSQKGVFEIAAVAGNCELGLDGGQCDEFDERRLLEVSRRYGADGILFCDVKSFSALDPLQIACSLTFFDTRESIVTLYTQGVWDSAQPNVRMKFSQFLCRKHKCRDTTVGIYMSSPAEYLDFVASDLTVFFMATAIGANFSG